MAEDVEGIGIFFGEDAKFDVLFERAAKIEQQAAIGFGIHGVGEDAGFGVGAVAIGGVDLGDQRGVGQARGNGPGDLHGSYTLGKIFDAAIGQGYVNLIHESCPDLQKNCRGCS